MTLQNEFIPQRCGDMTFPYPWPSDGDYIGSVLQKAATFEALNLKLELSRELSQIEGAKGLVGREAGGTQQSCRSPLSAQFLLMCAQFKKIGFM